MFELISRFVADVDADELILELSFRSSCRRSCSLQLRAGSMAEKIDFGHNLHFIADTDTETYYSRIVSAMILDRR